MFLILFTIIYYLIRKIIFTTMYIIYNILKHILFLIEYFSEILINNFKNEWDFIIFIYLYFIIFPLNISIFIITNLIYIIYCLINFELRKSLTILIKLFKIFLIWKFIGFIKSIFIFNWFLLHSFFKYYKQNQLNNDRFFKIVNSFLQDVIINYINMYDNIINDVINDKKKELSETNNMYFYNFIYDFISLIFFILLIILLYKY